MIYRRIFLRRAKGKLNDRQYLFSYIYYMFANILCFLVFYSLCFEKETLQIKMTLSQTVFYLIFSVGLYEITIFNSDKVANKVYKDKFIFEFLKPYSYIYKTLTEAMADFCVGCLVKIFPTLLIITCFGLFEKPYNIWGLVFFILSFVIGAFLWCNIQMLLQLLGFWYKDMFNVFNVLKTVYRVLCCGWVIYFIMPNMLQLILKFTPFYYCIAFPMEVYFGKLNIGMTVFGMFIQVVWISLFMMFEKFLYQIGRRKLQKGN